MLLLLQKSLHHHYVSNRHFASYSIYSSSKRSKSLRASCYLFFSRSHPRQKTFDLVSLSRCFNDHLKKANFHHRKKRIGRKRMNNRIGNSPFCSECWFYAFCCVFSLFIENENNIKLQFFKSITATTTYSRHACGRSEIIPWEETWKSQNNIYYGIERMGRR